MRHEAVLKYSSETLILFLGGLCICTLASQNVSA